MTISHFDTIAKRLAERRLSRRRAVVAGTAEIASTGLAATGWLPATAQDVTPVGTPVDDQSSDDTAQAHPESLFDQVPPRKRSTSRIVPNATSGWRRPSRFSTASDSAPRIRPTPPSSPGPRRAKTKSSSLNCAIRSTMRMPPR